MEDSPHRLAPQPQSPDLNSPNPNPSAQFLTQPPQPQPPPPQPPPPQPSRPNPPDPTNHRCVANLPHRHCCKCLSDAYAQILSYICCVANLLCGKSSVAKLPCYESSGNRFILCLEYTPVAKNREGYLCPNSCNCRRWGCIMLLVTLLGYIELNVVTNKRSHQKHTQTAMHFSYKIKKSLFMIKII